MNRLLVTFCGLLFPLGIAAQANPVQEWQLGGTDNNGQSVFFLRNFTIVTKQDKFKFELKMTYAPGIRMYLGSQVKSEEYTVLASCKNLQAQVVKDKIIGNEDILLAEDAIAKIDKMGDVSYSSPIGMVMQKICSLPNGQGEPSLKSKKPLLTT